MSINTHLLETFVHVARCRSMKLAAGKLHVTPGAISQRITQLEKQTGYRLFNRTGAGVELTERGNELFETIDEAFATIEGAARGIHDSTNQRRLVVSTVASFAATWLVPRLGEFAAKHPDIDIAVETDAALVDLQKEPIDFAIRHGLGRYRGLKSLWLMAPQLIVVGAPDLLRQGNGIEKPADCAQYPLIHCNDRTDWELWLQAHGVRSPNASRGAVFEDDYLVIRAAMAGQGIALVRDVYAQDALRTGSLVIALDEEWPTDFAYYLVGRETVFDSGPARSFCDWLTLTCRNLSQMDH